MQTSPGEEPRPIVLLIVAIDVSILFQGLICTFSLSISFGVVTGGEMEPHIQGCSKRSEEVGYKLRTMAGGEVRLNTMLGECMHDT